MFGNIVIQPEAFIISKMYYCDDFVTSVNLMNRVTTHIKSNNMLSVCCASFSIGDFVLGLVIMIGLKLMKVQSFLLISFLLIF